MSNEQLLAHYYRSYYMTRLLDSDIKNLKRINNIYSKFNKTQKIAYMQEIMNILRTLNNNMYAENAKYILTEYIDDLYKASIIVLIDNLDTPNQHLMQELLCIY